jgi:hypothetical protein
VVINVAVKRSFRERGVRVSLLGVTASAAFTIREMTASPGIQSPGLNLPYTISPTQNMIVEIVWPDPECCEGSIDVVGDDGVFTFSVKEAVE